MERNVAIRYCIWLQHNGFQSRRVTTHNSTISLIQPSPLLQDFIFVWTFFSPWNNFTHNQKQFRCAYIYIYIYIYIKFYLPKYLSPPTHIYLLIYCVLAAYNILYTLDKIIKILSVFYISNHIFNTWYLTFGLGSKTLKCILRNASPWGWPQVWPKHVEDTLCLQYQTLTCLYPFVGYVTITNQLKEWSWTI